MTVIRQGLPRRPIGRPIHEDTDATDAAGQEHSAVLSDVLVPLVRAHGARQDLLQGARRSSGLALL